MLQDDHGISEVLKHQVDDYYVASQLLSDVQENINRKLNRFIASTKDITRGLNLGMGILQDRQRQRQSENLILDFDAFEAT